VDLLNLFLISIPFWIPAAVGLYLVITRRNELSLMAGLLTLKPILTTPIWVAILGTLPRPVYGLVPTHLLSILPGFSLTVIIALMFRHLLSGSQAGSARVLLGLDCARWLNSFLMSLPYGGGSVESGSLACIFAVIGLALPTVFALVAAMLSLTRTGELQGD
jgi:hypothetical protein